MKRLVIICICFLCCMSSWAEIISVSLYYDYMSDKSYDNRSIRLEPTASHDGNLFYIHSYVCIENLQVTIKDVDGNVVYTDITVVPAGQTYSFTFDATEGGEYTLELSYGDDFLYGNFEL